MRWALLTPARAALARGDRFDDLLAGCALHVMAQAPTIGGDGDGAAIRGLSRCSGVRCDTVRKGRGRGGERRDERDQSEFLNVFGDVFHKMSIEFVFVCLRTEILGRGV
jgi:hypothetical protein